jgi:hypothetical protein
MAVTSQHACVAHLVEIIRGNAMSPTRDPVRMRSRMGHDSAQFRVCSTHFAPSSLWSGRLAAHVRYRRAASSLDTTIGDFYSCKFLRFDTRLSSVTGSGHIRRPAALGLLLRWRALLVSVPPERNSRKARHKSPANFLRAPPKKQTFGLRSRAHSRGFAMRAPSQFGSSKRR